MTTGGAVRTPSRSLWSWTRMLASWLGPWACRDRTGPSFGLRMVVSGRRLEPKSRLEAGRREYTALGLLSLRCNCDPCRDKRRRFPASLPHLK